MLVVIDFFIFSLPRIIFREPKTYTYPGIYSRQPGNTQHILDEKAEQRNITDEPQIYKDSQGEKSVRCQSVIIFFTVKEILVQGQKKKSLQITDPHRKQK